MARGDGTAEFLVRLRYEKPTRQASRDKQTCALKGGYYMYVLLLRCHSLQDPKTAHRALMSCLEVTVVLISFLEASLWSHALPFHRKLF